MGKLSVSNYWGKKKKKIEDFCTKMISKDSLGAISTSKIKS